MRKLSLQRILPPFLYEAIKGKASSVNPLQNHGWKGNYETWEEAEKHSQGYDQSTIFNQVYQSSLRAHQGLVAYERDSVEFDHIEYNWPLLSTLLQCMIENKGQLIVLDFGGSLGSTYRQNKHLLLKTGAVKWIIVEQKAFVDIGKKEFENENLKFEYTLQEAVEKYSPNVILLSSVLQYLSNHTGILDQIKTMTVPHLIIDRTSFIINHRERITVQSVPKEIYEASYPCRFFVESELLNQLGSHFQLVYGFKSFCDPDLMSDDNHKLYWKGFYFQRKNQEMIENPSKTPNL